MRTSHVTEQSDKRSDLRESSAGHHLARLPVDPRIGKLLLLAAVAGCLAPALSIATALSYKSPFLGDDAATRAKQALAAPGLGSETWRCTAVCYLKCS
jgi:HrpA-like RNA helicase